jgi:ABC-type branched-subunit amino acid transport system permease subunit
MRLIKLGLLAVIIAFLYFIPLRTGNGANAMRIGINICLYVAMAEIGTSWHVTRHDLPGQQLFNGVSGYAIAVVCTTYGLPFWMGFLVGGVISAMLAFCLSLFCLRCVGMYSPFPPGFC